MYRGKYCAVIGLKKASIDSLEIRTGHIPQTYFSTNASAAFPPLHQTTEFRQTTV
jgi:hypothetical protein